MRSARGGSVAHIKAAVSKTTARNWSLWASCQREGVTVDLRSRPCRLFIDVKGRFGIGLFDRTPQATAARDAVAATAETAAPSTPRAAGRAFAGRQADTEGDAAQAATAAAHAKELFVPPRLARPPTAAAEKPSTTT